MIPGFSLLVEAYLQIADGSPSAIFYPDCQPDQIFDKVVRRL